MDLRRRPRGGRLISLVPMIDVMLILLVFFMVTSSYLDLDMVPMLERQDDSATAPRVANAEANGPLFVRIGPDGALRVGPRSLDLAGFAGLLGDRLTADAGLQVLILPSGHAPTQALVSVMDAATRAGVQRLRIVRLSGAP